MLRASIRATIRRPGASRLAALEHTFGGNNNFNLVLSDGGSTISTTGLRSGRDRSNRRDLEDISPTVYSNVPKGLEMLLPLSKPTKPCAGTSSPTCRPSSTPAQR